MGDLDALAAFAKAHPAARADRIGVTGFCRGGTYTLLFAATIRCEGWPWRVWPDQARLTPAFEMSGR